jgi:pyruvate/2-oxoglutarate dehydrogenase complex dihydrolipoamide acyltransferase (E2) component
MAQAEERAQPGFYEHKGLDGTLISVQAAPGQVSVLQQSAGTFGRGAGLLTADEAEALAAGIIAAAKVARDDKEEAESPKATPAAAAHADELGVDLAKVEGTGAGGTITKADVAAHADSSA